MNLKRSLQNRLRGWIPYEQNLFTDNARGKISRKKIGSLLFLIDCIAGLFVLFLLYFMDSLEYVGFVLPAYLAVYLISIVMATDEYASYFSKHRGVYRVILAVASVFFAVCFLARPTYYLAITVIGLFGFDFILALLMFLIHDQNETKRNVLKTNFG
jgi:hypothetical protein